MFTFDPVTILASVVIILLLAMLYGKQKHKNFPPGPRPLPIIGNLHMMISADPHKAMVELSKKYGPMFTFHLGTRKTVYLCGYDTIKDAFLNHGDAFVNRPKMPMFDQTTKDNGISFSNGETWKAMRRFTLSALRDYGLGRKDMEDKIKEESKFLVKAIKAHKGQPFDNLTLLNSAVANIIISIILGHRFDYDEPTIQNLRKLVNENMRLLDSTLVQMYHVIPTLLDLLPGPHHKFFENMKNLMNFVTETFMKQKKDLDVNDLRNFIDVFLVKQQEGKSEANQYFHNENLTALVAELFMGGMETTTTTLRWAVLLMIKHPEIQKKVQKEIDSVIGKAQPQAEHRKEMPYTDAVIHEIQRVGDVAPEGVVRETTRDITFKGYFIPKGTTVFPLLHSALTDEAYFEKPHEFYPEHFLDAQGHFKKVEAFIPFSIGKRSCVGEAMAKLELFLFFTSLLQNFTFQTPPGMEVDLTPAGSGILAPKPHMICAVSRS